MKASGAVEHDAGRPMASTVHTTTAPAVESVSEPARDVVPTLVHGRHTVVPDRFRAHAAEKLRCLAKFDHKIIRVEVEVSTEHNPRLSHERERVQITCVSRGPVVRAEAAAQDAYAALDLAAAKLEERLRRAADRRHSPRRPHRPAAAAPSRRGRSGHRRGDGRRRHRRARAAPGPPRGSGGRTVPRPARRSTRRPR